MQRPAAPTSISCKASNSIDCIRHSLLPGINGQCDEQKEIKHQVLIEQLWDSRCSFVVKSETRLESTMYAAEDTNARRTEQEGRWKPRGGGRLLQGQE